MAKTDPHIVPDNNDDNEFATGFKGYSVEAHEEVRMKQHEMEEHARSRYDWDEKLLAVSRFIEHSGKRVQVFGKWISTLGQYMSRFSWQDFEEDQPVKPSRPTSPPNAIH